jgi:large repetitive protein
MLARNTSGIDATVLSATSSGDTGVGITLAFNTLGWQSQNFLFNAVDALLGDPLISGAFNGEQPAATLAYLRDSVDAAGEPDTDGGERSPAERDGQQRGRIERFGAVGRQRQGVGGVLASNKVSSSAEAFIDYTTPTSIRPSTWAAR